MSGNLIKKLSDDGKTELGVVFDLALLEKRVGSEACEFVKNWAAENELSPDTKVFYHPSDIWNAVKSMVWNETRKDWNGTFRTRLPAAINGKSMDDIRSAQGSGTRSSGGAGGGKSRVSRRSKLSGVQLDAESGQIVFGVEGTLVYDCETSTFTIDNEAATKPGTLNIVGSFANSQRSFIEEATELDSSGNPYDGGWQLDGVSTTEKDADKAVMSLMTIARDNGNVDWLAAHAVQLLTGVQKLEPQSSGCKTEFLAKWYPVSETAEPVAETQITESEPVAEPVAETVSVESEPTSEKKPARGSAKVS